MDTEYVLSYTGSEIEEKLGKIDNLATKSEVPTKISQLNNDSGYLTGYTETDPTVPAWAKASTKPSYTASEVGADASGTASSFVASHNVATDTHNDIREQIAEISSRIVSEIMTVTQAEYNAMTQSYMATLYSQGVRILAVDNSENSGNVELINLVPLSIDSDGNVYNGTGWKGGVRISSSTGAEGDKVNTGVTGFISVKSKDIIRFKDSGGRLMWNESGMTAADCSIVYYKSDFTWLGSVTLQPAYYGICGSNATPATSGIDPVGSTADDGIVTFTVPNNADIAYVRIGMSCVSTDGSDLANLIVTKNEKNA